MSGIFSDKKKTIDNTILTSLFNNLTDIFKFLDKDDKELSKTNSQIKTIILEEGIKLSDKWLYGKCCKKEELLKSVMETQEIEGTSTEVLKYKIFLKKNGAFEVPLLSRAYGNNHSGLKNGNEFSRDGWKYKGRGLKQLTGRSNYDAFTKWRKDNPFPGDETGDIDFTDTENKNATSVETNLNGEYLKISNNPLYATQSAFYFWFTKTYKNKNCYEYADKDQIYSLTRSINGGTNGLTARNQALLKCRKGLKVHEYYKEVYKNGNEDQKTQVKENIERIIETKKYEGHTVTKDEAAQRILNNVINAPQKIESIKIKLLPTETLEKKILPMRR